MAAGESYLLVAALDFGTTYSGYAFSFQSSPETIITNKNWSGKSGFTSHKTPSSILTDTKGNFLDMGYDAEEKYAQGLVDKAADLHLYRNFKMILHVSKNVRLNSVVTSLDDTTHPALHIFGYAIEYLRKHLLNAIKSSTGRTLKPSDVMWVLTVPAIWSDPAKKFMREAARRGGCISKADDSNLLLALEPEAASLCCRRLNIADYDEKYDCSFPGGTKYIVLDCGGGTVDVTAHKIIQSDQMSEISPASGGPWGGQCINEKFEEILIQIFGSDFIKKFKTKYPNAWYVFLASFETAKKAFTGEEGSKIWIRLPFAFAEKKNMSVLLSKLKKLKNDNIKLKDGILELDTILSRELFTDVESEIVKHIESLLSRPELKEIDYILMVGGFSESVILQNAIKKCVRGRTIRLLTPHDCQLAIMKGAVSFGHHPLEITSRISRVTIGHTQNPIFDLKIHDSNKRFKESMGNYRCSKVFDTILLAGESIQIGEEKRIFAQPINTRTTTTVYKFYSLPRLPTTPVQYTDEDDVEYLGTLEVSHLPSKEIASNKMEVVIMFGGTEIHVRVIHVATGSEFNTKLNFLSDRGS